MNGKTRLEHAAKRSEKWHVSEHGYNDFQDFINSERELMIQVIYSGYTIKGAKLWDFSPMNITNSQDDVAYQKLTSHDRDKATRIEDVLLGNSRRF